MTIDRDTAQAFLDDFTAYMNAHEGVKVDWYFDDYMPRDKNNQIVGYADEVMSVDDWLGVVVFEVDGALVEDDRVPNTFSYHGVEVRIRGEVDGWYDIEDFFDAWAATRVRVTVLVDKADLPDLERALNHDSFCSYAVTAVKGSAS